MIGTAEAEELYEGGLLCVLEDGALHSVTEPFHETLAGRRYVSNEDPHVMQPKIIVHGANVAGSREAFSPD